MNLGESEELKFRHAAEWVGHGQGDLVVTSLRCLFQLNGQVNMEKAWAALKKPAFAPDEHMMQLRFNGNSSEDPPTFKLIGSSPDQLKVQLARLRELANALGSGPAKRKAATSGDSSGAAQGQGQSGDSQKKKKQKAAELAKRRQQLLAADSRLAQSYREWVVQEKILSEEEFWVDKQALLTEMEGSIQAHLRGTPNRLLTQVQPQEGVDEDGNATIKYALTLQNIQAIFKQYPQVHAAYMAKVPEELTELEFWNRYYDSEFYARDQGKRGPRAMKSDDMFSRFARDARVIESEDRLKNLQKKLIESVDVSIDLQVTLSDRLTDSVLANENEESLDANHGLASKYNKNSTMFFEKPSDDQSNAGSSLSIDKGRKMRVIGSGSGTGGTATLLEELQTAPEPDVMPLKLKKHVLVAVKEDIEGDERRAAAEDALKGSSAFGKRSVAGAAKNNATTTTTATSPALSESQTGKNAPVSGYAIESSPGTYSSSVVAVEAGMGGVFGGYPYAFQQQVLSSDREQLIALEAISRAAAGDDRATAEEGDEENDSGDFALPADPAAIDLTGSSDTASGLTKHGLPIAFEGYLGERFEQLTKTLQHYYSHMERASTATGAGASDAITKLGRIYSKIGELERQLVQAKDTIRGSDTSVKNQLRTLNVILELVSSANVMWNRFAQTRKV
jgi:hypothetical protein